jgi:hypothetical protein
MAVSSVVFENNNWVVSVGEGPKYRPFRDLRSVPKVSRPREQVENNGGACTSGSFS